MTTSSLTGVWPATRRLSRRLAYALIATTLLTAPGLAAAQTPVSAAASPSYALHIPSGSLEGALVQFASATGQQLIYSADLTRGLSSPGLDGQVTLAAGLERLLGGTGLTFRVINAKTVTIEKPIPGAHTLGAVQVEGVQTASVNGFGPGSGSNGSSDPTATEGTGSFTTNGATVASKTPETLKDTPQSVTVITQERIQQQNMTDLGSALLYTPGITLYMDSTVQPAFYSRGFTISTFQLDGGAPISLGVNSTYDTVPNLAEYDNVQVLRGSDALFGGSGQPGGVVSLQRKRPLDHDQLTLNGSLGSWDNYIGQIDATGPIALDGHVRARVVANIQDRDFFYDDASQQKEFVYGVLEADLGAKTLVRVGASYEHQRNPGYTAYGLPRYSDGSDLNLPRTTNLAPPWQNFTASTPELFAALESKFNKDWTFKANFTRLEQTSNIKSSFLSGAVYRGNPSASTFGDYSDSDRHNDNVQYAVDATLNGAFEVFGLEQKVTFGADYSNSDSTTTTYAGASHADYVINVFSGTLPSALLATPKFNTLSNASDDSQVQWGSYATLNIQPIKNLHLVGGVRVSSYWSDNEGAFYFFGPTNPFKLDNKQHQNYVATPYAAATYGLTPELTLYASFADIFQPQGSELSPSGQGLSPVTGDTYEAGIKGAWGDKLNASWSFYYTKEQNLAIFYSGGCAIGSSCYLDAGEVTSKGIDMEVAGEILPGWQIQAGYNYNDNKNNEAFLQAHDGNGLNSTYQSQQPKHQLKLWTSYVAAGALKNWTFGGGFRLESARYATGSVCSNPADTTGRCKTGTNIPFAFTQGLYTVTDLRAAYRLNAHWEAALNITNVGDTRYYQTVGSSSAFNFYGEPRAYMLSVSAKY